MKLKVAIVAKDSIEKVWACWTEPEHIKEWYHAADTWYVPSAESDFRTGGKFKTKMAAMDKSGAFDFEGVFTAIKPHEQIDFTMADGRKVVVKFAPLDDGILITEEFEATSTQGPAEQEMGWQLILRSFKNYVETTA